MVILQFNKLIRNKMVWGVFAIAVSAFFCFDYLIPNGREASRSAGEIGGKPIDGELLGQLEDEVARFGAQFNPAFGQDSERSVSSRAREVYAAIQTAKANGLEVTDEELTAFITSSPMFQDAGAFSKERYRQVVQGYFGMDLLRYETFLRHLMMYRNVCAGAATASAWVAPVELAQAVSDATDVVTVQVATFTEDKAAANAITVSDDDLKTWYAEHDKDFTLPERIRLKYVKLTAEDEKLAGVEVSDADLLARYEETIDVYTSTDTNNVDTVKPFEEVKDLVAKDLKRERYLGGLETSFDERLRDPETNLTKLAEADKLELVTSPWLPRAESDYREGFSAHLFQVCPDAQFRNAVADFDMEDTVMRYQFVKSADALWIFEIVEVSPSHVPTFEEAKVVARPKAEAERRQDHFKATVEAVREKGVEAVLASGNVSTNLTLSYAKPDNFGAVQDARYVIPAAVKLAKGEISPFIDAGAGRALMVVCNERVSGEDLMMSGVVQDGLSGRKASEIAGDWSRWNLVRLGGEPKVEAADEAEETAEASADEK